MLPTRNPIPKTGNAKECSNYHTIALISHASKVMLKKKKKKDRLAEWIQKQDQYICCLQETHFILKDTYRLKVRGWKNIFHANGKQKKAGVAILISDKIDLKIKITIYIMIKGSLQEEDITIVNIYAPNIGAPQYIRHTKGYKRKN